MQAIIQAKSSLNSLPTTKSPFHQRTRRRKTNQTRLKRAMGRNLAEKLKIRRIPEKTVKNPKSPIEPSIALPPAAPAGFLVLKADRKEMIFLRAYGMGKGGLHPVDLYPSPTAPRPSPVMTMVPRKARTGPSLSKLQEPNLRSVHRHLMHRNSEHHLVHRISRPF